jgi:spermidine/putrescine transport system permease protein
MTPDITGRRRLILAGLLAPVSLFLGVFFLGPLAIIGVFSLLEPGLYGGVEWNFYHWNFGRILGWADGTVEEFDIVYLLIFLRSLKLAFITVVLCLVLCYPVAFWISRLPDRWKTFFLFLIVLPFFASLIVRLYAWILILKPSGAFNQALLALGLIDRPLDLIFTENAVITGMVYVMVPFMFLPIYASVEKLDRSLLEASHDLGATSTQTFLRVIFPLTLPGIVGGSILVFIPTLGNFIVPDILGGARVMMIGNLVEQQFLYARNWAFGAAISIMIVAIMLVFLLAYVTLVLRHAQDDQSVAV